MHLQLKKAGHFFKQTAIGAVVGLGGITPGVSGGIMAVAFGIYYDMISALGNLFKEPKKSILYLLPLGLGMLIGILSMSTAIEWLMLNWRTPFLLFLVGLVAGGVPKIVQEGNKEKGFHPKYIIAAVGGALFLLAFSFLGGGIDGGNSQSFPNAFIAILTGAILSISTVIPGIGVSFILIFLGWYSPLIYAINRLDVQTLLLVGIGFIAAIFFMAKLVQKVFEKYREYAYYAILGFTIASIIMIFTELEFNAFFLLYILLAVAGFFITTLMNRNWSNSKNTDALGGAEK